MTKSCLSTALHSGFVVYGYWQCFFVFGQAFFQECKEMRVNLSVRVFGTFAVAVLALLSFGCRTPKINPDEVLVEMKACGICYHGGLREHLGVPWKVELGTCPPDWE